MLKTHGWARWLLIPYRFVAAARYPARSFVRIFPWLLSSREVTDVSYDLSELSRGYLAEYLSVVTGFSSGDIDRYLRELETDEELREHARRWTLESGSPAISDPDERFGKRMVWYALIRAVKPKVVVEAGVNRGLGTCVIASALRRNLSEGHAGRVYGIDIDPAKGYLFRAPYTSVGELHICDIRDFLSAWNDEIDVFVHDTQNLPWLEREEYQLLESRLSSSAWVCSVWSSGELLEFGQRTGRRCLSFALEAKDHWYPGSRIAIAFSPAEAAESDPPGSDG